MLRAHKYHHKIMQINHGYLCGDKVNLPRSRVTATAATLSEIVGEEKT